MSNSIIEDATQSQHSGTLREINKQIVCKFLQYLEAMDIESWADLWAEDGVQEMPYPPQGLPDRVIGKAALYKHYKTLPEMFVSMRYPISLLQTLEDPEWVIAEYTGEISIKTGGHYNNRYCTLFHIRNGKIVLTREYFNPLILMESIGDRFNDKF